MSSTTPARGSTLTVTTDSTIVGFSLNRLAGVTHTTNTDARRVPLAFLPGTGNSYSMTIPTDPGVVPAGYYYLFAMNAAGVPSVARIIRIN